MRFAKMLAETTQLKLKTIKTISNLQGMLLMATPLKETRIQHEYNQQEVCERCVHLIIVFFLKIATCFLNKSVILMKLD